MTLGSGARRVLALHCTMAFGGAWAGFAKALPDLTLVAPDMPSHGRSADWDEVSDFSDTVYAAALSAMDDTPMDLIGHSFGAVTALRIAVSHPERVRSVTVIEPVFFAIARADAPHTLEQHDSDAGPFRQAIAEGDHETAARVFNRMWSTVGPKWQDMPERTRAAMKRAIHVVPDTHAFLYDDASGIVPLLGSLSVPALLVRGEHAHPAIIATIDGLERRIPGAVMSVISGAGHMAPISNPGDVAAEVSTLLSRY